DAGWSWPPFGGRGRGGPWARPDRRGRFFDRGDLKYVILDLLAERPRHGYDIIRALEEQFEGLYSPSPGTVYPTLQLLEDQGYVTSNQQDGKKVYTVTEAGRAFLAERAATIDAIRARMEAGRTGDSRAEVHALMGELRNVAQTVFSRAGHRALDDPEKVRRLRGVVARAREEIDAILADRPAQTSAEL
ncbi:MAG: helix-turn-helix transcriptional regulator, partial [Dehalococcoidia bacterium]